jgi:hypothetical protein
MGISVTWTPGLSPAGDYASVIGGYACRDAALRHGSEPGLVVS